MSNLFQFSINSIAILSIGHYDSDALPPISLALLIFNLSGACVANGIGGAFETWGIWSKDDSKSFGSLLNLSIFISFLYAITISIAWIFGCEPMLLFLGQDPFVAYQAKWFLIYLIPALYAIFATELLKRFLTINQLASGLFYIALLGVAISILGQGLLVWLDICSIGIYGSSLAISLTFIVMAIVLFSISFWNTTSRSNLSFPCMDDFEWKIIGKFTGLAISNSIMVFSEWIAFESISLSAGILGAKYLSAQTILIHIDSVLYMIPLGLGGAATVRIGTYMGRGD